MGRLIAVTAKSRNGNETYAKPRVVYVNEDMIKVTSPSKTSPGLSKIIEESAYGEKDTYLVYEKAMQIEAARNPSSTDIFVKQQIELSIAALGANQAAAAAITKYLSEIDEATAGSADGVRLPAATVGKVHTIINNHATVTIDVFPAVGDFIDSAAVDVATSIAPGDRKTFVCLVADYWVTAEDFGK